MNKIMDFFDKIKIWVTLPILSVGMVIGGGIESMLHVDKNPVIVNNTCPKEEPAPKSDLPSFKVGDYIGRPGLDVWERTDLLKVLTVGTYSYRVMMYSTKYASDWTQNDPEENTVRFENAKGLTKLDTKVSELIIIKKKPHRK